MSLLILQLPCRDCLVTHLPLLGLFFLWEKDYLSLLRMSQSLLRCQYSSAQAGSDDNGHLCAIDKAAHTDIQAQGMEVLSVTGLALPLPQVPDVAFPTPRSHS